MHQLSVINGGKEDVMKRLWNEPWSFSGEELDRLFDRFLESGELTPSDLWEIMAIRVQHRAENGESFREKLEGRLLSAVAAGNEQAEKDLLKLLKQLNKSQMEVVANK